MEVISWLSRPSRGILAAGATLLVLGWLLLPPLAKTAETGQDKP